MNPTELTDLVERLRASTLRLDLRSAGVDARTVVGALYSNRSLIYGVDGWKAVQAASSYYNQARDIQSRLGLMRLVDVAELDLPRDCRIEHFVSFSNVALDALDIGLAIEKATRALQLCDPADAEWRVEAMCVLSACHEVAGQPIEAASLAREAISVALAAGGSVSQINLGEAWAMLGDALTAQKDFEQAKSAYGASQQCFREANSGGDNPHYLLGQINLANLAILTGNLLDAEQYLQSMRKADLGSYQHASVLRMSLAECEALLGVAKSNDAMNRSRFEVANRRSDLESPANSRSQLVTYCMLLERLGDRENMHRANSRLADVRTEAYRRLVALLNPLHQEFPHLSGQSDQMVEMLNRLASTAELRDDITGKHCSRVGRAARLLAMATNCGDARLLDSIEIAGRLHDIGKIGVPDAILSKRDRLSADEFELMKTHTTRGASLLEGSKISALAYAYEVALSHHERWDGGGYPRGLAKESIPLSARIVAIADVFDAMTHSRPYRLSISAKTTLEYISGAAGTHFDPHLARKFVEVVGHDGEASQLV
ncbi:MAG: HD domain-containing protein [Betaproteobacteria bacterium]|nr:MAG: HD domain-containing protein [Betaproteobacteria bacterium]